MTVEKIFVGRKAELEQFKKVLEDPQGQAASVIGQSDMNVAGRNAIFVKTAMSSTRVGW